MAEGTDRGHPYRAYVALVSSARQAPELWRVAIGIVLVWLVSFGALQGVIAVAMTLLSPATFWAFVANLETGKTPTGLLVLLFGFVGMAVGVVVVARSLHKRSLSDLVGPLPRAARQGTRVLAAVAALYLVVILLPPWQMTSNLSPNLPFATWLALLPLSLAAILVQTFSEELFFRGYVQSQIAARFPKPAVWIIGPALLFGLGHYAPSNYGPNTGAIMLWAVAFGIAMADLTARAGTLGPAIAVHFANNVFGLLFIAMPGQMSGLALFLIPTNAADRALVTEVLPVELGMLALSWLAARIALRR